MLATGAGAVSRRTATPSPIMPGHERLGSRAERIAVDARVVAVLQHAVRALARRLREGAGPRLHQRGAVTRDGLHHGAGGGQVLVDALRVRARRRRPRASCPAAPKSSVVALSP